ncbi:MAG: diguanylate cyclase [Chitinispirillaceae bacterium]|nr:diguanylate cyclase [Chitinispirillaceae bacterium]
MTTIIRQPQECRILVVDDEEKFCELMCSALKPRYPVTGCLSGREACGFIGRNHYDVVVTDLRLSDCSGIDVLRAAKQRDPYTEVLLITGYASFESASIALELGAISYIEKPVKLDDFLARVEKAVASRIFHCRSLVLMQKTDAMSAEFKDHLSDITALYYFTRKVTVSLEVAEIVRITLDEISRKSGAPFCAVGCSAMGFREIYAMSRQGEPDPARAKALFLRHREAVFPFFEKGRFEGKDITTVFYKGAPGTAPSLEETCPTAIPLMVTGTSIGALVLFLDKKEMIVNGDLHYYNVVSSIVAPLIEHGYSVRQVRQLARTDALTGIANHRSFHEALDHEIARANRKGSVFSLIFMDIDDFKRVNDTYGHLVGDAVLKDLVKRVSDSIRVVDEFSRYGGEEFAIVLPETALKGAEIVARRIKTAITAKPFIHGPNEIAYTVSMGIALYNGRRPSKEQELINKADAAMYAAKRDGKNRISLSTAQV